MKVWSNSVHITILRNCFLLLLLIGGTAHADLSQGLIAYYPFTGNSLDESGNLNHTLSTGAALTVDRFGQADNAYIFDGVNDTLYALSSDSLNPETAVTVTCESADREILLVEWLNALVYEMATRRMLFGRFEVTIEDGKLRGTAWGEAIDVPRHEPAAEVKGATLTLLKVAKGEDGIWSAQCVVDV